MMKTDSSPPGFKLFSSKGYGGYRLYLPQLVIDEIAREKDTDEFGDGDESEPVKRIRERHEEEAKAIKAAEDKLRAEAAQGSPRKRRSCSARAVKVFDLEQIAAAIAKIGKGCENKKLLETALGNAQRNDGFRRIPKFSPSKLLSGMEMEFPNFADAIEDMIYELSIAASSRPQDFWIRPILLDGAPGIGKTRFANALAERLGVAFRALSAGGLQGGFTLAGTSSHWSNTRPGMLYDVLSQGDDAMAVVLVDEIDKVTGCEAYPVVPALLSVMEPESARQFRDESLEIAFDASRVFYIGTSNVLASVPDTLRSRMTTYSITPPTPEQRLQIGLLMFEKLRASTRNKKLELDRASLDALADSDIDFRQLIAGVRRGIGKAISSGSGVAVVELPRDDGESSDGYNGSRKFGFLGSR